MIIHFIISGKEEFPYTILLEAKNLFSNINILSDDWLYSINEYKKMSTFYQMDTIQFNNIKEWNILLSSQKVKFQV